MRSRYLPEFNMNDSIETVFEEKEEIIHIETDDEQDVVVMSYAHYTNLISDIAYCDQALQDDVLRHICNQIVGWEDLTASLNEVSNNLSIELELVLQVIFQNEDFYSTDGVDRVTVSPIAWEYYLDLKAKDE